MGTQTHQDLDKYYKAAGSWAYDKIEALENSKKLAWIIAIISLLFSILLIVAFIILLPLKKIVPYTLLVDKQTGFVETLKPMDMQAVSADSALTQSFLVQYVVAREEFDINSLQNDYRKILLWTGEPERSTYKKQIQASNPESPLSLYPRTTVVNVKIKSVSPLGKNTNLIRFDTQRVDAGGRGDEVQSWASVIRYQYKNKPMSQDERFTNPLGFEVLHYNKSQENITEYNNNTNQTFDPTLNSNSTSLERPTSVSNGEPTLKGQ